MSKLSPTTENTLLTEAIPTPLSSAALEYEGEQPVIRRVVIIEAGASRNGRTYPAHVIERDGPDVFADAPVYATNHNPLDKTIRNLVGYLRNVRFEEGRLIGDLVGFSTEVSILQKAVEAHNALGPEKVGLSIDTLGHYAPGRAMEVAGLVKSDKTTVDLVMTPAARGRLAEAHTENVMEDEIPTPETAEIEETVQDTVEEAVEAVAEAVEEPAQEPAEISEAVDIEALVEAKVEAKLKAEKLHQMLEAKCAEAKDLGETIVSMVRNQFEAREFTETEIDEKIAALRTEIGKRSANRPNVPNGVTMQITESFDKRKAAVEGLVRGRDVVLNGVRVPKYNSVLKALREMAGVDVHDGEAIREAMSLFSVDRELGRAVQMQEAIQSDTFTAAWADAMYKVMMDEARNETYSSWRLWCEAIPFADFRERSFVRQGGYSELTERGENETYTYITTPDDEEIRLAITKHGDLERYTWESLRNDDVMLLRRIPVKLGRAWARTISNKVYSKLQDNVTLSYDSTALYHASHGNIVDSALGHSSLLSARTKMRKQTELGSGAALGLRPRYLFHTPDLNATAVELVGSQTKNTANQDSTVPNYFASAGIIPVEVDYPSTTTTRAELVCDPADLVGAYVGFLDGREDLEVFISNAEAQGSMLTNDAIVIKVRGTFGVAIADHRAFVRING